MSHETELNQHELRALRQLNDELRAHPAPELDWDRVEADVMRRTELEAAARRKSRVHSSWGTLGGFAAAAAAVVLMIAGVAEQNLPTTTDPSPTLVDVRALPTVPGEPDSLPIYRVGALQPHSVIQSGAEPVQMTLDGVVTWTLEPNSRAVVRTTTVPHVIELEQGAVSAEVIPRHDSNSMVEAFAVEVEGTRVAVHGTVFSVERVEDVVHVEVTRGSVSVGPSSYRGPTNGLLLAGPARAVFEASTGRFMKRLPVGARHASTHIAPEHPAATPDHPQDPAPAGATTETPAPAALPQHPNPASSAAPTTSAASSATTTEPEVPPTPAEPAKISTGQAASIVSACIRSNEKAEAAGVHSSATVKLDADGKVIAIQFNPPLNPKYQSTCGGLLFGSRLDATGSVSFGVSSK